MSHDRRMFLRSALTAAGGLLLPLRGAGALELDATTPHVPVSTVPLPVSGTTLEMRRIKQVLHDIQLRGLAYRKGTLSAEWRETYHAYDAAAEVLLSRPVRSWADCVEMAEVCWHTHWKGWDENGRVRLEPRRPDCIAERARINLIEGVLALGGGQRFDPSSVSDEELNGRT